LELLGRPRRFTAETENLRTTSRFKSLFVIARNSSFTYKSKAVDIKQVGRELGVRYVLEGSVRRAGGRVRITAQLIEAAQNKHLWAEKLDGDLSDIFALQDTLTMKIVSSVSNRLEQAEIDKAKSKLRIPTKSPGYNGMMSPGIPE
jgi:adenylate cyclase